MPIGNAISAVVNFVGGLVSGGSNIGGGSDYYSGQSTSETIKQVKLDMEKNAAYKKAEYKKLSYQVELSKYRNPQQKSLDDLNVRIERENNKQKRDQEEMVDVSSFFDLVESKANVKAPNSSLTVLTQLNIKECRNNTIHKGSISSTVTVVEPTGHSNKTSTKQVFTIIELPTNQTVREFKNKLNSTLAELSRTKFSIGTDLQFSCELALKSKNGVKPVWEVRASVKGLNDLDPKFVQQFLVEVEKKCGNPNKVDSVAKNSTIIATNRNTVGNTLAECEQSLLNAFLNVAGYIGLGMGIAVTGVAVAACATKSGLVEKCSTKAKEVTASCSKKPSFLNCLKKKNQEEKLEQEVTENDVENPTEKTSLVTGINGTK